jgi:chaperonin cofactor prefoldin
MSVTKRSSTDDLEAQVQSLTSQMVAVEGTLARLEGEMRDARWKKQALELQLRDAAAALEEATVRKKRRQAGAGTAVGWSTYTHTHTHFTSP